MTTKQLDQEQTLDKFIETVEEAKQQQHPTVANAVSGYVQEIDNADGAIYVKIDVPAYDDEIREKVAKVDGTINKSSILYPELVSELDDISKLPTQNPIPIKKIDDEYEIVQTQDDFDDRYIDEEKIQEQKRN